MNKISSKRSFLRSAGREMALGEFSLQLRKGKRHVRDSRADYARSSGPRGPEVPAHTAR